MPAKSDRAIPGYRARAATMAERSAHRLPPAGNETSALMPGTNRGSPSTYTMSTANTSFSDLR
eukprot:801432-Prymnesium_polylepis.2